ncbi:CPBP family intramembrane metalloprotease [Nocardiopsis dassonvillei]|uniref:CPBP family intramembrane glutamic endopeptidase n=1 Tax=Nocardiopsis dassonvillei TaxID=2014 RepID=UPI0020A48461|nr:CPBP family intramembrane glutamic endopeptidase [Nocardiopsis dassonvillei]MCP3015535.1 CPBP family intramembrane metalloprotease [Nocardiopsis dassonvillei]
MPPPHPVRRVLPAAVLVLGLAVIAGSALLLLLTGETGIRYSADHDGTVPMWTRWVPALAGVALVLVLPRPEAPADGSAPEGRPLPEALALTGLALLFAVALYALGGGEPAHTLLKLALLLAAPSLLLWWPRRSGRAWREAGRPGPVRHGWAPAVPVLGWAVLTYAGPFAMPPSDYGRTVDALTLVATVVVVFLVNALLEEVFYRRWLQSRWEAVLGAWPAIVLSSLLWACWHVAIQGRGDLPLDLAMVFVNQGVQGLFLGLLWSRYRRMWPILVVHGLVNSGGILLGLL